ncbi:hypothetical protein BD289DRAFT_233394 [Coniella lustricola]|uniref:Secreted protein n=1 Tax=Coniella lustricola TaxID=2025994 RepID=A0A2T3AA42_9PEZI|nr:hypothetical protein BD289DRAFT_233394 [Coniella lustricola]
MQWSILGLACLPTDASACCSRAGPVAAYSDLWTVDFAAHCAHHARLASSLGRNGWLPTGACQEPLHPLNQKVIWTQDCKRRHARHDAGGCAGSPALRAPTHQTSPTSFPHPASVPHSTCSSVVDLSAP